MQKKDAASTREAAPRRPGSDEPFSRPFVVDRLRADTPTDIDVAADADERTALAEIDGVERVDRLEGRFRVARVGSGAWVTGEVEAEVIQICVVTLEPFATQVREAVDVRYAPEDEVAKLEAALTRVGGDPFEDVADAAEVPDPIVDGRIDLGALAAEFLALGLDPYPRKPGARFENEPGEADTENVSPFATLRPRAEKP